MANARWELYDSLIDLVPSGVEVRDYLAGRYWTLVRTTHVGMAMASRECGDVSQLVGHVRGMPAKEAASLIKSWDPQEAALGLATINSVLNTPERVFQSPDVFDSNDAHLNVFDCLRAELAAKRVAVVGHFRGLERLASECQLSILERLPQRGDMPDPACEYILNDQDYVFITGTTLMNKTLPRLLELSRGATVVLVGPSTPMSTVLFRFGVAMLAGTVVTDTDRIWQLIQEGDQHRFFDEGARMTRILDPQIRSARVENAQSPSPSL